MSTQSSFAVTDARTSTKNNWEDFMLDHAQRSHVSRRSVVVGTAAIAMMGAGKPGAAVAASDPAGINFQTTGSKDPTLIFVHGFACALSDWDGQVKALSPNYRCAALDLPGHGNSAKPEEPTIEALAKAVNSVKDRVGGGKAILIGHSMGCRVILEAFLQSKANIAGLVFVDGSILGGDPETGVAKARDAIAKVGMDAFSQRLFNDMFLPGADEQIKQRIVMRATSIDAKFREELFVNLVRWDLTKAHDGLKQLTVPALVLQATYINAELKRSPIQAGMTTPWMDAVAQLAPKSESRIIPNSGHFAMIDAVQPTNDEINKFALRAQGA
jgi:pimeloyl-ACP methyl ester carboxylesterase